MELNSDEVLIDEEMANIIMRHLDVDKSGDIDREEFKSKVTKWLNEIDRIASHNQEQQSKSHDNHQVRTTMIKVSVTSIRFLILADLFIV